MIKYFTLCSKAALTLLFSLFMVFTAKAKDTTPPIIILNTPDTVSAQIGSIYTSTNPTITDNQSDINSIIVSKSAGFNGNVNSIKRGWYTETYEATDSNGNKSSKTRYIIVDDFIAPIIILNTADTIYHKLRTAYNSIIPAVSDNYYAKGQISLVKYFSDVDANVPGMYYEKFEAVDASLNITRKTRVVIVGNQTSIHDINSFTFSISPNPVHSEFTLLIRESLGLISIQILAMDGKIVFEKSELNAQSTIETSDLGTGIYTVLVHNGQKTSAMKLQIQH